MTLIAQPKTYSDVLERVFRTTVATGIVCSLALAGASTEVKKLFEVAAMDVEFGPVKGLPLLYIAAPFVVALASRVVKLHDLVSDVLGLRRRLDTEFVLFPLAEGVGVALDDTRRCALTFGRIDAMYRVFYPYVSLPESKIDQQLVRTALDNLGWFWVAIEALVLMLPTTAWLLYLEQGGLALGGVVVSLIAVVFAHLQWQVCKRSTAAEVRAILADAQRREHIATYLGGL